MLDGRVGWTNGGDPLGGGHAARRLHLRGDPGRDLDRERQRTRDGRHPRQPRVVAGPVPGDPAGRAQLDGEPASPEPAQRRSPQGRLRDPAERRLPALLLELRGRLRARLRPRAPPHERGGSRHRASAGGLLAPARRAADRGRRRAGRRRRGLRREERRLQVALRHGPAQPRERRGHPGYGYPVVLSGDDTFDAPASQLYLHRSAAERTSGTTTARSTHSSRTRRRSTTMATSPRRCRPSPATSSRSRLRSRPASSTDARSRPRTSATPRRRPGFRTARSGCSRPGATRTTCSSSSASRTSPTTGGPAWLGSSTSPTRVSPARSRTRRPAGCAEVRPGPEAASRTAASGS